MSIRFKSSIQVLVGGGRHIRFTEQLWWTDGSIGIMAFVGWGIPRESIRRRKLISGRSAVVNLSAERQTVDWGRNNCQEVIARWMVFKSMTTKLHAGEMKGEGSRGDREAMMDIETYRGHRNGQQRGKTLFASTGQFDQLTTTLTGWTLPSAPALWVGMGWVCWMVLFNLV